MALKLPFLARSFTARCFVAFKMRFINKKTHNMHKNGTWQLWNGFFSARLTIDFINYQQTTTLCPISPFLSIGDFFESAKNESTGSILRQTANTIAVLTCLKVVEIPHASTPNERLASNTLAIEIVSTNVSLAESTDRWHGAQSWMAEVNSAEKEKTEKLERYSLERSYCEVLCIMKIERTTNSVDSLRLFNIFNGSTVKSWHRLHLNRNFTWHSTRKIKVIAQQTFTTIESQWVH